MRAAAQQGEASNAVDGRARGVLIGAADADTVADAAAAAADAVADADADAVEISAQEL